jgi:hypothetical protein
LDVTCFCMIKESPPVDADIWPHRSNLCRCGAANV